MTLDAFLAFVALSFMICVVPGPNVTLIVATSAMRGWRAGFLVTCGASIAMVLQVALVTLGLAWIVESFGHVFEIVRYAGAAYLIWLGIQTWRSARDPAAVHPQNMKMLRKGFLVGLANPKSLAFFAAFFPQFVDPAVATLPQFTLMGVSFAFLALLVNTGYTFAGSIGSCYLVGDRARQWLARGSGALLIGGGALLAGIRRG